MKSFFVAILSILITYGIYHAWFSFDAFLTGDWNVYYSEGMISFAAPSMWESWRTLGTFDAIIWKYPYDLLVAAFGYFGLSSLVSDKFLILLPLAFFSLLFSYLVLQKIVKFQIAALIGAMYFAYSSYILTIHTHGHQHLSIAGVWGVLALYFCMQLVEKRRAEWAVLAGMMLSVAGYYDFRMAYIFFFVCSAFLFVSWVRETRNAKCKMKNEKWGGEENTGMEMQSAKPKKQNEGMGKNDGWKLFWLSGLVVVVFIGLNVFWVLPFMSAGSLGDNAGVGRELFGSHYFELDDAMYLSHPFWTGYGVRWFSDQATPWWLSILGILAWVGFFVATTKKMQNAKLKMKNGEGELRMCNEQRRRYILFFAGLAIVGILLSKQTSAPLDSLYFWLYDNLPGFNAFREASKFYILIALAYAVGIASLVEWLLPKKEENDE